MSYDNQPRPKTELERMAEAVTFPEFEQYLQRHAAQIRYVQDRMFSLIQQWVMVNRRYRGVTISDQIGGFSHDPDYSGMWIDPVFENPDAPDVHPINIVRPDIRANVNACLQANPSIEIEPSKMSDQEPKKRQSRNSKRVMLSTL